MSNWCSKYFKLFCNKITGKTCEFHIFKICFSVFADDNLVKCNGLWQFVAGDIYTRGAYTWQDANDKCSKYNATLLSRLGSSHWITSNCWQPLLESVKAMKLWESGRFWASLCQESGENCGFFEAYFDRNTITFFPHVPASRKEFFFFPICERGEILLS